MEALTFRHEQQHKFVPNSPEHEVSKASKYRVRDLGGAHA
jgi:hypothetical protein